MADKLKDTWDKVLIAAQIFAYAAAPFVILAVTLIANHQLKERETSVQELAQAIAVLQANRNADDHKDLRAWAEAIVKQKMATAKSDTPLAGWIELAATQDVLRSNAAKLCMRPAAPLMEKAEPIVPVPEKKELSVQDLLKNTNEVRLQYELLALRHNALIASLERSCGYLSRAFDEAK